MSRDMRSTGSRGSSGTVRRNGSGKGVPGKSRRKRKHSNAPLLIAAGVIVVLIIALVLFFRNRKSGTDGPEMRETGTTAVSENIIKHNAVIDLSSVIVPSSGIEADCRINVRGMTPDEISRAVSDRYDWSLKLINTEAAVGSTVKPLADINETTEAATLGDAEKPDSASDASGTGILSDITVSDSIEIPDLIAERIPALIKEITDADARLAVQAEESSAVETSKKSFFGSKKESSQAENESAAEQESETEYVYKLTLDDIDEEIDELVAYAANMWYVEPLGGSIGSYDKENDTFIMENSREGFVVDRDSMLRDILAAVSSADYTSQISVTGTRLSAEDASNVSGAYRILATYTTNTTSNAVRNKNIRLACEKLNGTIVRPGEEFSFNTTVGQRTREAGYGEAAAYNNGEVVMEVGGGVCQVSTTLYNAVLKAGLKTTARQSHTFKPTYVTPGQDATISWGGPDFRFANLPNKPEYSYNSTYAIGIRANYSDQVVTVSIYGRPVLKEGYTLSLSSQQTKTIDIVRKLIEPGSDRQPTTGTEGSVWETRLIVKKGDEVISNDVDHNAYYSGHIEYYTEESSDESESESDGSISDIPEGPGGPGSGMSSDGSIIVDNDAAGGPISESMSPASGNNSTSGAADSSPSGSNAGTGMAAPGEVDSPDVSGSGSGSSGGPSGGASSSPGDSAAQGPSGGSSSDQSPDSGSSQGPSGGKLTSPSISSGGPGT